MHMPLLSVTSSLSLTGVAQGLHILWVSCTFHLGHLFNLCNIIYVIFPTKAHLGFTFHVILLPAFSTDFCMQKVLINLFNE